MIGSMEVVIPGFCGLGMYLKLDGFRLVYVCIAVLMWVVSGVFSREYMAHYKNKMRYYVFFWATFVATVGVFLSADLYTTFIFFEIMSFTSYVWVAFDERKESLRAAETYLAVAVIGGLAMLMGLFLLYDLFGTLEIDRLSTLASAVLSGKDMETRWRLYVSAVLLLFGFGAKAGCFPLHIWLPKAHPEAPAPASALLSGILTKAGVFGIIVVSCGMLKNEEPWGLLIAGLGLITMFLGALLAVFSINLKRTLACSSISQIGFILTGIGMSCLLKSVGEDNTLALHGAFLHMVNHSLFKLVLFLCAGAVFMNLHQLNLNDIRGFGRKKPVLMFCFLMGALGIGGFPLWNGYVSKTLIHESIVEFMEYSKNPGMWKAAEWVFLFSGGMTVAYMLKLFVALFIEKHPQRQKEFDGKCKSYMNRASASVLAAAAALLPVLGLTPHLTMDRIAGLGEEFFHGSGHEHVVSYFSWANLKGGLISIGIGLLLYAVVIRGLLMEREEKGAARYADRWPAWLDLENLIYRPVLQKALPAVCGAVCRVVDRYVIDVPLAIFTTVSTIVCRLQEQFLDGLIRLARVSVCRQLPEPREQHDADLLAHILSGMIDQVAAVKARFSRGRAASAAAAVPTSVLPQMIKKEERLKEMGRLVEESFSFGLILFCIGLFLTLAYLLAVFFTG